MSAPLPRRIGDARGDVGKLNTWVTNVSYDVFTFLKDLNARLEAGLVSASTDAILTAIQALLTTLNSIVSTAANQTTGNTSLSTIATNTMGVSTAANQTTGNTSLSTIATNTTGVSTAANQTSANTKLDTLHTDLGTTVHGDLNPTTCVCLQASVSNSSATLASQLCTIGAWVKNISTSNQLVYIFPGGTATTANGYQLAVGEERFFACRNLNELRAIASAASANVCAECL